ncbi:MAG: hypothetical protein AAFZ63_06970 [Bacteroidota bacterium]
MKNLTPFLALLLAFAVVVSTGCNNDDDDNSGPANNSLVIDGTSYDLGKGFIEEFGPNGNGSFDWDVTLTSSDVNAPGGFLAGTGSGIYLDLNTNDENGLVAGTYNYEDIRDAFTLVDASTFENFDFTNLSGTIGSITSGTVTVDLVGNEVRLEWDLSTTDNKAVTGSFQGTLEEI